MNKYKVEVSMKEEYIVYANSENEAKAFGFNTYANNHFPEKASVTEVTLIEENVL